MTDPSVKTSGIPGHLSSGHGDPDPTDKHRLEEQRSEQPKPNIIPSPEERRRRILEMREARLRRILGRSPGNDEIQEEPTRAVPAAYVELSRRHRREPSIQEERQTDGLSLNTDELQRKLLIIFYISFTLLVAIYGLPKYSNSGSSSCIIPFLIVEVLVTFKRYLKILKSGTVMQLSSLGIIVEFVIRPLQDMLTHFAVYFLSLCLFHAVFIFF